METVNIEELVQDRHNFNKGTDEGSRLMEKSFTELGAGRSILIDKDGNIIAGNKSQLAAMKAGIKKVRVIESDGSELIAVKRTDVAIDSKKGRELALADNLTTQVNLSWDEAELETVAAEQGIDLPDWGLDPAELELTDEQEIERKRQEFERRMAAGEISEEDEEYQAFKEKFELKKTTDDCYTPELVYEAVADWVANEYGVNRKDFVRPFYPGGDYQKEKYPKGCIVVDNPPFSIESEIVRFYREKGIRFFLFGPQLTLFSKATENCTCLPMGIGITYANGAVVATGFVTNMDDPEIRFRTAPALYDAIKKANDEVNKQVRKQLPKYQYPKHIITTPLLGVLSRNGVEFKVTRAESELIGQLDSQKDSGTAIFGHGYLVSDRVCAEREKAELIRIEKEKEDNLIKVWELSDREREIIKKLNEASK
jgi:hypothetical protein